MKISLFAAALAVGTSSAFLAPSSRGLNRVGIGARTEQLLLVRRPMADASREPQLDQVAKESATSSSAMGTIPLNVVALGGFSLLLFGAASWFLQKDLITPCLEGSQVCTEQFHAYSQFFVDHPLGSFVLIMTHAIPFVLIPTTMRLVADKAPVLQKYHPTFNPFVMQLGLATICISLAMEFGWHVTSAWYYENDFHVLNFNFYFFLISSFALWADGFENTKRMDLIFGAILLVATILYPLGSQYALHPGDGPLAGFLDDPNSAKIPLYVALTVTFTSLTQRGWKVFGPSMGLVFFFSVVVNLIFIFFLQSLPPDPLSIKNYIYHIGHDLLGTEAGVAIFAYLVANYDGPPDAKLAKK